MPREDPKKPCSMQKRSFCRFRPLRERKRPIKDQIESPHRNPNLAARHVKADGLLYRLQEKRRRIRFTGWGAFLAKTCHVKLLSPKKPVTRFVTKSLAPTFAIIAYNRRASLATNSDLAWSLKKTGARRFDEKVA